MIPIYKYPRTILALSLYFTAALSIAAPLTSKNHPNSISLYYEPLQPLQASLKLNLHKIKLGERLFNEIRLGKNNDMSCATCHLIKENGAGHLPLTIGRKKQKLDVNTPTVFNSSVNQFQFWDGRAANLEDQINFVVSSRKEFATSWQEIINKLKQDKYYTTTFNRIYSEGISKNNIRNAIAIYEQTLITTNSRFDQYLLGNNNAISSSEKQGYRLFKNYGCIACHQGSNVGGNLFMRIGIFGDYLADRGKETKADLGRFNVTGKEEDRYVFRVPSLRLAALTPPYMHDGSVKTLHEAIKVMAKYQLGRTIPDNDIQHIEAFIKTLPGQYKGAPLTGHSIQ